MDAMKPVDAGQLPIFVPDDDVAPFSETTMQFAPLVPLTDELPKPPASLPPKVISPGPKVISPGPKVISPGPTAPKPVFILATRFPLFQTSFWIKLGVVAALVLASVVLTRGSTASTIAGVVLFGAYVTATALTNKYCSPKFLDSRWCKAYTVLG